MKRSTFESNDIQLDKPKRKLYVTVNCGKALDKEQLQKKVRRRNVPDALFQRFHLILAHGVVLVVLVMEKKKVNKTRIRFQSYLFSIHQSAKHLERTNEFRLRP